MVAVSGPAQMPTVGDMIAGKFLIERLIGRGGMGAVFAARHVELESVVAVKVMLVDSTNLEGMIRFKNEGRAAAKIRNDHVVRVEDVGEENGYAYMILELLDGEDFAQMLAWRKRLPVSEVVEYMLEALDGVKAAHEKGIIHRDLKPSNLFLATANNGGIVKVLDFGISKSSSFTQSPRALTSTTAMLGSPQYMSPEQLRSPKSVDMRADIWALGIIMYELLTGTLPFTGETLGELFAAILESDPTPVRARVPEVPAEIEAIVMRCLQHRPEHRFQAVSEIIAALKPFSEHASVRRPNTQLMAPLALPPAVSVLSPAVPALVAPPMQTHAVMSVSLPGSALLATAPIGAITPQPQRMSGGFQLSDQATWQTTSTSVSALRSRKGFVVAVVAAGVLLIVAGVLIVLKPHPRTFTSPSGTVIPIPPPTPLPPPANPPSPPPVPPVIPVIDPVDPQNASSDGKNVGQTGTKPGQTGTKPGQTGTKPGQTGTKPGAGGRTVDSGPKKPTPGTPENQR